MYCCIFKAGRRGERVNRSQQHMNMWVWQSTFYVLCEHECPLNMFHIHENQYNHANASAAALTGRILLPLVSASWPVCQIPNGHGCFYCLSFPNIKNILVFQWTGDEVNQGKTCLEGNVRSIEWRRHLVLFWLSILNNVWPLWFAFKHKFASL